jgi:ABC-type polysaccharide/polyol phosphate transport system ATPase subunit
MDEIKNVDSVVEPALEEVKVEKPVIEFSNVTMEFAKNSEKIDGLKEFFVKFLKGKIEKEKRVILDDVSFTVNKGESVAILGHNGAGKSTTLKIISGIIKPTKGHVKVRGNVAPLLNLGVGFDYEGTAKENVYLNGAILGHPKKELEKKFNKIIDFAELHDYVNVPLKNFSSGMIARLGFAIAIDVNPDIMLVDEILSVGDENFRKKCAKKVNELREKGVTFVIVSHNMGQVKSLCQKAIWIENSEVMAYGDVNEVCEKYQKYCNEQ